MLMKLDCRPDDFPIIWRGDTCAEFMDSERVPPDLPA